MNFYNNILSTYKDLDYLSFTKAKLLFYFLVTFIFLVLILQISMLMVGWFDFVVTLPVTGFLLLGFILSMNFLRIGKYITAANVFITVCTLALMAGLIRQPFMEIELSLTSYMYFIYPCIALCAILSTVRFLVFISALHAITDTVLFIIMKSLPHGFPPKMATIAYINSIFSIGFIFLISLLILKVFERSVELANGESEKSSRANRFIKKVLMDSSKEVVVAMNTMAAQSDIFSENAHDQSTALNEISATVSTVSSGIDQVAGNAREQTSSLEVLLGILEDLSHTIRDIDRSISESLSATHEITKKAESGEQSLMLLEEGIRNVNSSSLEMTNIIAIINDISDKINLLSLNAAIEAARAGDSGRGFAVVADEISKLADGTVSSIKSIESLIGNNEKEIARGLSGASMAVEVMKSIIAGIGKVDEKIGSLNEYKQKQIDTNSLVNEKALVVMRGSTEISLATIEQKNAIKEIVERMSSMSERSMNSTATSIKMSYDAKSIVDLVFELEKKIEGYRPAD